MVECADGGASGRPTDRCRKLMSFRWWTWYWCLLIIFMLTAHVMDYGQEVDVPKTKLTKENNDVLPVVEIRRGQMLYLNGKSVNINDLVPQLAQAFQGSKECVRRGRQLHTVGFAGASAGGTGRRTYHGPHGHETA